MGELTDYASIKEELISHVTDFGINTTDTIIEKFSEMCITYNIEPEELIETWLAYSVSNLDGADPTIDGILQMERKDLCKKDTIKVSSRPTPKTLKSSVDVLIEGRRTPSISKASADLRVYDLSDVPNVDDQQEAIFNTYNVTPKMKGIKKGQNETSPGHSYGNSSRPSPKQLSAFSFAPISYSPTVSSPSQRYETRTNAGASVLKYGKSAMTDDYKIPLVKNTGFVPSISLVDSSNAMKSDVKYMFEKIAEEAEILSNEITLMAKHIARAAYRSKPDIPELEAFMEPFQETRLVFGRLCKLEEAPLSEMNLGLEGTNSLNNGLVVAISLNLLDHYSLFPGQVVVVSATNPTGEMLIVHELHYVAPASLPKELPSFTSKEGPLHIVAAAGPYTQNETLNYKPLEDLREYVIQHKPHVLILIGPLLDDRHKFIVEGSLATTYDDYFIRIINSIAGPLKHLNTQIIIIASSRDAFGHAIYPTPAFSDLFKKCPANVTLMPDPCMLSISGVIVGITATDIIKHLSGQEISRNKFGSISSVRLHRLGGHLLNQQSFYPLYPPDDDVAMEAELFRLHGHMDVKPHILITPSNMRSFITIAEGSLIVNPERLAKGQVGGMFVHMMIPPHSPDNPDAFVEDIASQIIRI